MKVLAVLLVSLATASSVIVEGGSPSAVQLQLQTLNGTRNCGGTLIRPGWVLSAAHCTSGALRGTVYAGYNGSFLTTLREPSFISHPNFDVSLIYLGSDLPSTNISYPTFYTDTIEEGQMGRVESVYPGYMGSIDVKFRANYYCSQFIENYSNLKFCTDQCVRNTGASVLAGGKIVGVVSWGLSPVPREYKGPCAYTRVSAYISWINANAGVY